MRHSYRVAPGALLALACLAAAAGAADRPDELIVGKWGPANGKDKGTVEFAKNGKLSVKGKDDDGKDFDVGGTYKFIGDDALDVVLTVAGEVKKERLKVKVDKDELSLTDSKKRTQTFKRAK